MLKTRNGRNEKRREGQSFSSPIMRRKLRKMGFFTIMTQKRPRLPGKVYIFNRDKSTVHIAAVVGVWFAAVAIQSR